MKREKIIVAFGLLITICFGSCQLSQEKTDCSKLSVNSFESFLDLSIRTPEIEIKKYIRKIY